MSRRRVALRIEPDGSITYQPYQEGVDPTPVGITVPLDPGGTLQERLFARTIQRGQRMDEARDEARRAGAGGAAAAGALNFADELLYNLPSYAIRRGLNDQPFDEAERDRLYLDALLAENPGVGAAGRVLGAIIPAILTGGDSLLARGAMLTPGGFTAVAGNAAEAAIGRALGSGRLGRFAGTLGGATIDGALSGATQAITDSNITGSPLDAEHLMANVGLGSLLGLGAGSVLGTGRALAGGRAAVRAQETSLARAGLGELASDVDAGLQVRRLELPQQEGADAAFGMARLLGGTAEEPLRAAVYFRNQGIDVFDRGAMARRVGASADQLSSAYLAADETLGDLTNASRRQAVIVNALDTSVDTVPGVAALRQAVEDSGAALRALADGDAVQGIARLANASDRNIVSGLSNEVRTAMRGMADAPGTLRAVDNVLDYISSNNLMARATPELQAALETLQTRLLATAEQSLGEAGSRLARTHAALRDLRAVRREVAPVLGRELAEVGGDRSFVVSRQRLGKALVEQLGEEVSEDQIAAINRLQQSYDQALGVADGLGLDTTAARTQLSDAARSLEQDRIFADVRTRLRHAGIDEAQGSGLMAAMGVSGRGLGGSVGGAIAGSLIGGPVGAVVGGLAGGALGLGFSALSHPIATLQRFSRMTTAVNSSQQRVAQGVSRLRTFLLRGARFSAAAGRNLPRLVLALQDPKRREREYRGMLDRVRTLSANPDALMGRLEDTVGPLTEVHPVIGDHLAVTAVRGAQYLASQIPPADIPSPFDHLMDLKPSQVEMDSFIRRVHAVEDPLSILEMAADGRLTSEHVEAVSAVYPQLYAAVQGEVAAMLGTLDRLPPYAQRLQIGTLLGVPIDSTMDARFIHAMQQSYAQTQQQDQAQTSRGTRLQVSTRIADNTYSESQELSLRL